MAKRKTWEQKHPRAVTDSQVRAAVKAKASRMKDELKKNPNNKVTSARLAEFKNIHRSKLDA